MRTGHTYRAGQSGAGRILLLLSGILGMLLGCYNPFFPPTGKPLRGEGVLRSTPQGVIDQLVLSYETRRIDLFKDLFAKDGSFRYYIPEVALEQVSGLYAKSRLEVIDSGFVFVSPGSRYYYITLSDELAIHRNMFEQADDIRFLVEPDIDYAVYNDTLQGMDLVCICDSAGGTTLADTCDTSCREREIFDTVSVEILTRHQSRVAITSEKLMQTIGTRTFEFDIYRQVFFLRPDPADSELWVIDKWFELP